MSKLTNSKNEKTEFTKIDYTLEQALEEQSARKKTNEVLENMNRMLDQQAESIISMHQMMTRFSKRLMVVEKKKVEKNG